MLVHYFGVGTVEIHNNRTCCLLQNTNDRYNERCLWYPCMWNVLGDCTVVDLYRNRNTLCSYTSVQLKFMGSGPITCRNFARLSKSRVRNLGYVSDKPRGAPKRYNKTTLVSLDRVMGLQSAESAYDNYHVSLTRQSDQTPIGLSLLLGRFQRQDYPYIELLDVSYSPTILIVQGLERVPITRIRLSCCMLVIDHTPSGI